MTRAAVERAMRARRTAAARRGGFGSGCDFGAREASRNPGTPSDARRARIGEVRVPANPEALPASRPSDSIQPTRPATSVPHGTGLDRGEAVL